MSRCFEGRRKRKRCAVVHFKARCHAEVVHLIRNRRKKRMMSNKNKSRFGGVIPGRKSFIALSNDVREREREKKEKILFRMTDTS